MKEKEKKMGDANVERNNRNVSKINFTEGEAISRAE